MSTFKIIPRCVCFTFWAVILGTAAWSYGTCIYHLFAGSDLTPELKVRLMAKSQGATLSILGFAMWLGRKK